MKILLSIFFITGFMFLSSFLTGCFFIFNKNSSLKLKSAYSIFLALCMALYIVSVIFLFLGALYFKNLKFAPYVLFALFPFFIGKISSYKRLKFYTALQIIIVLSGCVSSFLVLINY